MIKKAEFLSMIRQGSFRELFVTELGWNRYRGQEQLPPIVVDDVEFIISAIAERNGFQILCCEVDNIPTQSIAKKIDVKLRRQAADYICIYRLRHGNAHDLWVVPVRSNEKRDLVLVEYEDAKAELLYSKIEGFTFDFDEVTNIVDLRSKVQGAFAINSEKITKDFYAGFKKEHKAFAEFITGIDDHVATKENRNKQWYTSVMLNRLMFCYFIQKKGFLDLDHDYLRNKLKWVRQKQGENRFFKSFYRGFLSNLFHDGLNSPHHDREFERMYGKIPYLNGGMFDEHQLERDYADIDIADEAFMRLFDFFDTWRWHLDTRLTASGKDINPDVLGYIFEQYINDRAQMGAYYTKEDITEYIGRNCILPFLFDEVRRTANDDGGYFAPEGYVWKTLRESGDSYIFDAVKKGYADFNSIPENISRGIITDAMRHEYAELPVGELPDGHVPLAELRADWNTRTPEQWGLPSEIWRETIERLQRCGEILSKIKNGEITSINDFITYNLDIRSFAHDLLAAGDSRFVGRFYHALQRVTILDPTCGSGAFLFAAMNILEPLYEICIERMQEFNSRNPQLFKAELAEISNKYRSNIQYFIFKSIILRNLYGVDIMVEATEIAKLRLFLKMVAVVDVDRRAPNLGLDPLPDIDFNIRCGNTLVGYANKEELERDLNDDQHDILVMLANQEFKQKIEEEMKKVSATYKIFKNLQLNQEDDMAAFKQAKHDLRVRLEKLNDTLNRRLFKATQDDNRKDTSGDIFSSAQYADWLKSHQPFHWLAEFYQIIAPVKDGGNGGFDVIIGNPPYVEISKNKISYQLNRNKYKDLYAYVMERILSITHNGDFIGLIIPISFNTTPGFKDLYDQYNNGALYISCYADTAKMFQITKRISIVLKVKGDKEVHITHYIRENSNMTNRLTKFPYSKAASSTRQFGEIPAKISFEIEKNIIIKYFENTRELSLFYTENGSLIYYTRAIRNFRPFYDFIPYHKNPDGSPKIPTENKSICIDSNAKWPILCILNSSLTFLVFYSFTDVRNINPGFINQLRIPNIGDNKNVNRLGRLLIEDYNLNKEWRFNNSNGCSEAYFYPVKSKSIIDKIDCELAKHYGFTEEELDFIINYDIKYRMGDELNNNEN